MTLAWKTEATPEEVEAKREEFWNTRTDGQPEVWQTIKSALLETNPRDTRAIIQAAGLKMIDGSLLTLLDSSQCQYRLPVYVINDPEEYGPGLSHFEDCLNEPEEKLTITLRNSKFGDLEVNTSTYACGKDLDSIFCNKFDVEEVKIFFNGRHVVKRLGAYGIKTDMILQVAIRS